MDSRILRGTTYYLIDAVAFVVNISIAWALTEYAGVHYVIATVVGFFVQTIGAFSANKVWTFPMSHVRVPRGLAVTTLVQGSVLLLAITGTVIGVEYFHYSFLISRVAAGLVAGLWGYMADSYITFGVSPLR